MIRRLVPSPRLAGCLLAGAALVTASPASAQSVQDLQAQIDELKATVAALQRALAAQQGQAAADPAPAPPTAAAAAPAAPVGPAAPTVLAAADAPAPPAEPRWYDRLRFRGYTQLRVNEFLSGDQSAPAGLPRLRSVHDGGIGEGTNFTFRRLRLILEGDVSDRVSLYLQTDFANNVQDQSVGERREGFLQLRDMYADIWLDAAKTIRLRAGQSKVPFGWENLQSSSNRVPFDRSDAINSAVPSERDLGLVLYWTPPAVQAVWDRLEADGQKLFGNYGAFGIAAYNGQGINRQEQNEGVMLVAMATWPFVLDGLGLAGQVLELGGSAYRNRVNVEQRTGGTTDTAFPDERIGVHAVWYPAPFGVQAEWNWGRGPEFDATQGAIRTRNLSGGYVQAMLRLTDTGVGSLIPYAKWQRYRGGWKALVNAPPFDTREVEAGVEWELSDALELTVAYAHMRRADTDERRPGIAQGSLIRTQLQWNY